MQDSADSATAGAPTRAPAWSAVAHYAALALCIVLPYANAIPNGFVWDDNIQLSKQVPEHLELGSLFTQDSWLRLMEEQAPGSDQVIRNFRPLLLLSFLADAALWGENAYGYHLTSLGLFCALGLVLLAVFRALTASRFVAFACVAVYCTQPALTESVSWISGRHDVLMTLWLACSTWCVVRASQTHARGRLALLGAALGSFVLALLSKEPAATYPVVLAALLTWSPAGRAFSVRERVALLGAHVAIAAGYLVFRSEVIAGGNFVGGSGGALAALAAAPHLAAKYLGYFFYLPHLTSHYLQAVPRDFGLQHFVLPLLLHLGLVALAFHLRKRLWALPVGMVLYYATLAPAAVMVANKPELSLRFAFLPSLGLVIALAAVATPLVASASHSLRRTLVVAFVVVLGVQAARIHLRNSDYQSDYVFYASVIRDEPLSHFGYYGLGNWLQSHGRLREAEAAFVVAIERAPGVGSLYNNLAVVLMTSQRLREAEAVLGRGIVVAPRAPRLFYNRGTVRMRLQRFADAERDLRRALELDPGYRKARRQLYELYQVTAPDRARELLARHPELR